MNYSVHVLNVGHGDSIIVQLDDGNETKWGVIDCHNPDSNADSPTLTFLKNHHVNKLCFVCMTHPDKDHFSGITQLLKYYTGDGKSIEKFYDCGISYEHYEFAFSGSFLKELEKLYALLYELLDEGKIEVDQTSFELLMMKTGNSEVIALGPDRQSIVKYTSEVQRKRQAAKSGEKIAADKNLLSVVICVTNDDHVCLLCSDATRECMEHTLERWKKLRKRCKKKVMFGFVKVPHHGSRNYNTNGLWKNFVVDKGSAAISAGQRYDLPHKDVVRSITLAKKKVYCTNKSGCLEQVVVKKDNNIVQTGISPLISLGLGMVSLPARVDKPYHGRISWVVKGKLGTIDTEYPEPAIVKF